MSWGVRGWIPRQGAAQARARVDTVVGLDERRRVIRSERTDPRWDSRVSERVADSKRILPLWLVEHN